MRTVLRSKKMGEIIVHNDIMNLDLKNMKFSCLCVVIRTGADAALIIALFAYSKQNSKANVSIKFKEIIIGVLKNAPAVPAYSAGGPSRPYFPYFLKPDVVAPGSYVSDFQ